MILTVSVTLNLKTKEVAERVKQATKLAMRDTVSDIAQDAIHLSPVLTGNNRRSIFFGAAGFGHKQASGAGRHAKDTWTGEDASTVDESKIEGAVYGTSGYSGFLETGHATRSGSFVAARPYFKPALDRNFTQDKFAEKTRGYLGASA